MTARQRLILLLVVFISLIAAWLWWNRTEKVDLAEYAPADALVFLEANELPHIVERLASTQAWRALAPAAGLEADPTQFGWLSMLAGWTSIGPAELVIYSRAQLAVVVLGFDAAEEPGAALNIRPQAALLVETHSSDSRAQILVDKIAADFARRAYGTPQMSSRVEADARFTVWTSPDGSRQIVAAQIGSLVIFGNNEAAVQSCLAVKRGERPALIDSPQLGEMRGRLDSLGALAFGYVSPAGTQRILEVAAIAYAGQLFINPKMQSALATLLPQIAERFLGSAGWSSRVVDGAVEDRYFLAVSEGLTRRLSDALASLPQPSHNASAFLPANTYQLTRYNSADPEIAWRGLNSVVSSNLDITLAPFAIRILDESLKPYGIESPRDFLQAVGPEVATARLDESGESLVLLSPVRDPEAVREQLRRRLSNRPRRETIGAFELLIANDPERGAASLVSNYLITGEPEDVRRCLETLAASRTLAASEAFQKTLPHVSSNDPAGIVTFTVDRESAQTLITLIARRLQPRSHQIDSTAFGAALSRLPYSLTETRLLDTGFERKTRSAFGLFGTLAKQFEPEKNSATNEHE